MPSYMMDGMLLPSASHLTQSSGAVFLSYASEDAAAAQRICEALRASGIEVWFDQSELRGGDAWDAMIRRQIKSCALFIPIISSNSHARAEGYFRLEWKLAVDRSHLIAPDKPFLVPVVIDQTRDNDLRVPDRFRELQWTPLPEGETSPAFVQRVARLLGAEQSSGASDAADPYAVGGLSGARAPRTIPEGNRSGCRQPRGAPACHSCWSRRWRPSAWAMSR